MRQKIETLIVIAVVALGIGAVSIALLVVFPAILLKWLDVAIFVVFIGLSILCIVRHISGSVLALACWIVICAVNVILRLYPFSPDAYTSFVAYALPAAETVCALLTGLWLIRLLKGKVA